MSVIDTLLDLFRSEETQAELAESPADFLEANGLEGLTAEQVLAAMPDVCAALPPEQAEVLRTAYGISGAAGTATASAAASGGGRATFDIDPSSGPAGPPPVDPGADPIEQVVQQLNYFTTVTNTTNQSFQDNDVTNIDDSDTIVDNSVNQDITAFGDVDQTFDNDVVSGDGAVAAGDDAQVNTGDGAVQAGGDIEDSNVVTGDVEGSVLADDISDSVVGDDNQVISDSTVGAASFGEGDATNVDGRQRGPGRRHARRRRQRRHRPQPGCRRPHPDRGLDPRRVGGGRRHGAVERRRPSPPTTAAPWRSATGPRPRPRPRTSPSRTTAAPSRWPTTATQTGSTDNSVNDSFDVVDSFDSTAVDNSVDNSVDYDVEGSFNDSSDNSVDNSFDGQLGRRHDRRRPRQRRHRHPLTGRPIRHAPTGGIRGRSAGPAGGHGGPESRRAVPMRRPCGLAWRGHPRSTSQWRETRTPAPGRRQSRAPSASSTWGGRRPRPTRAPTWPTRLAATRRRLSDPAFHVFVVGEFKQGKSSLVNALLNAPVCPVDDDIATAVPTAVRYGDPPAAAVLFDPGGDLSDPDREPDPRGDRGRPGGPVRHRGGRPVRRAPGQLGRGVAAPQAAQRRARARRHARRRRAGLGPQRGHHRRAADGRRRAVRVRRQPGVHRPRARVPADRPAHVPQRRVRADQDRLLPGVAQDPRPRRRPPEAPGVHGRDPVRVVDAAHPRPAGQRPRAQPRVGLPAAGQLPAEQDRGQRRAAQRAGGGQRRRGGGRHARDPVPERAPGPRRPRAGPAAGRNLTSAKAKAERLQERRSKWQQTLSDGIADLQADVDHDLRGRLRQVTRQADEAIDASDPAETWDEFQPWLYRRVAEDVVHNYTFLHAGPQELTARVAEHFGEDGADIVVDLDVRQPHRGAHHGRRQHRRRHAQDGRRHAGHGRAAGHLRRHADVRHARPHGRPGPGQPGDDRHRPVHGPPGAEGREGAPARHAPQPGPPGAPQVHRRGQLRRRQGLPRHAAPRPAPLRDYFAARAEELHRSTTEALAAAQQAVKSDAATRPEAAPRRRRRAQAHRRAPRQGLRPRPRPEAAPGKGAAR